ncbi:hypothetical protein [Solidesulfovibrio alcoholivorans]|uniref:hypothetical protein n=1 Tax=Solidesulfovibrio alcoholivorans TaxID=81406 RepID=UPI0012EC5FD1|nr:hypothetical protein [Solidesulfovibrio alcoholivorans]
MSDDKRLPKIKTSGIANVKGKDVASYGAKLDYAHQFGIKSLEVKLLQMPNEENGNTCIALARLEKIDGSIFEDVGDATPENVPRGCSSNYIRMASTRAKSRVLSDGYNIGAALQGDDDHNSENDMSRVQIMDAEFTDITGGKTQYIQVKNDGGGTKPATERQLNLIKSLASQQSLSPSDLADGMFHKSIEELQGGEASQMIKRLKKEG